MRSACPLCAQVHDEGQYETWEEISLEGTPSRKVAAPEDVKCRCGLVLRFFVPLVAFGTDGILLRPIGYHTDPEYLEEDLIEVLTNNKKNWRFK